MGILVRVDFPLLNTSQKPGVVLAWPGNRKLRPTIAKGRSLSWSMSNDHAGWAKENEQRGWVEHSEHIISKDAS